MQNKFWNWIMNMMKYESVSTSLDLAVLPWQFFKASFGTEQANCVLDLHIQSWVNLGFDNIVQSAKQVIKLDYGYDEISISFNFLRSASFALTISQNIRKRADATVKGQERPISIFVASYIGNRLQTQATSDRGKHLTTPKMSEVSPIPSSTSGHESLRNPFAKISVC